jgi:uncharacterized membrane protein
VLALMGTSERMADARAISVLLSLWSTVGLLFSAWLTYLELAVIQAICIWCVVSAILVTAIFALSVLDLRDKSKMAATD